MNLQHKFTIEEAREIGDQLGVNWNYFDLEEFRRELEYNNQDSQTNVTNNDLRLAGKIAWAHLKEFSGLLSQPRPASDRGR